MARGSDCTHIFGLVVNPCSGSGPDGHSRTGSSSDNRPLTARPATRIPRRRSDRLRHHPMSLASSHDRAPSSTVVRSGTRRSGRIGSSCRQQSPEDPGLLGGQRDHGLVEAAPGLERRHPATGGIGPSRDLPQHRAGSVDQQGPQIHIPALGDPAQPSGSPPLEWCRGTKPNQAASWSPRGS
jgi:hypothetical protein